MDSDRGAGAQGAISALLISRSDILPVSPRSANSRTMARARSPIGVIGQSQENGGNLTRPRAAADFPMIRARMEELRHERARPHAANTRPGMKAGSISRTPLQDFPRSSSMVFSIPRPSRPEGFSVKN